MKLKHFYLFLFWITSVSAPFHLASADTVTPSTVTTPIPLQEVPSRAESASDSLRDMQSEASTDPVAKMIVSELPNLAREIDARHQESSKILGAAPTVDMLRSLEREWKRLDETLDEWNRDLSKRVTELDEQLQRLDQLEDVWRETSSLSKGNDAPAVVQRQIQETLSSIEKTRGDVSSRRANILSLESHVAEVDLKATQALLSVKKAREQALGRLMTRDSPPFWSAEVRTHIGRPLLLEGEESLSTQLRGFGEYARRQAHRFFIHAVVLLLLALGIYLMRRKSRPWVKEEPEIESAARVLDHPLATALLLSILVSGHIYPQAPRLWWAAVGAFALFPTIVLLRRILDPYLFPILNALMAFYFVDRLRLVAAAVPILSRLLFLAESVAGLVFLVWLLKPERRKNLPATARNALWDTVSLGTWAAIGILCIALLTNLLGYVGLANLLGNAVMRSAYLGVMLYAILRIVDVFLMFPLRVGPLAHLGMVQKHRIQFWERARWWLQQLAVVYWVLTVFDFLAVRAPLFEMFGNALSKSWRIGSIGFSLNNLLGGIITIWGAFLISRFIRFVLEEDVYPRVSLGRGLPYAISTVLHYAILVIGFVMAMGALGVDMTKFTILAGAFGVGLGFGLQTILNNFFSGLILLFERPIKIGDFIEIGGATGVVERIGIRASAMRTTAGSEVIIPNGNILSSQFTNWTFSARQRALELSVSVVRGADPKHVIELLEKITKENPHVAKTPPPRVLFDKFSAASSDFLVHAWTQKVDDWLQVRSDLTMAINDALVKENLALK